MYKCINNMFQKTDIFNNFFKYNREVHLYDTRASNALHVPYGKTNVRKLSFKIHGAHIWNSIPHCIKTAETIYSFKFKL